MAGLKCHSSKTRSGRRKRSCSEGSGISLASVVDHWNRRLLQKCQMGWEVHLCLMDIEKLHS